MDAREKMSADKTAEKKHPDKLAELDEVSNDPNFYPHEVKSIEIEETHISKVYLTGPFVYKIKKPVNLGFLDFTTLEKRRHYCEREVALNQRLSHGVYLGVVAITKENKDYALDGSGEAIEYAVKMRQLPKERTMLELLRKGQLSTDMIKELAETLARFYKKAGRGKDIEKLGTRDAIRSNNEQNFEQTRRFVSNVLNREKYNKVQQGVLGFLENRSHLFEKRIETGYIRDCHGDLRSNHIYFLNDIQIIDCIEFNDRFRYSDITADIAFLVMGLDYQGFSQTGTRLVREYVKASSDHAVYTLLNFYKRYRAFVRCKVECLRLEEKKDDEKESREALEAARKYFDLAHSYCETFVREKLWVVCGLSASGKSTIADEIAKIFQLNVYRSDVIRKRIFGFSPHESAVAEYEKGIYTPEATRRTYETLLEEAKKDLVKHKSVILDATFSKRYQRERVLELSREMKADPVFVECICSEETQRKRIFERKQEKSVSDARIRHLSKQRKAFEPLDELDEETHLRISTEKPVQSSIESVLTNAYMLRGP